MFVVDGDFGGYRVFVYFLSVSNAIVSRELPFNVRALWEPQGWLNYFCVSALATHSPKSFTPAKGSLKVKEVISVVLRFFSPLRLIRGPKCCSQSRLV